MPIQPAIPFGGLAGLRFLDQTIDRQTATFNSSVDVQREVDYFLENASNVTSVEQLVGDRRLLGVVLGAFGLDEDIDKGAFIRKVIEEGSQERTAFANRLVEPAYREMAEFLGFGDFGGTLVFENTRLNIVDRYLERQFELSVGDIDLNLRLALNFRREAAEVAASNQDDDTAFLLLLGSQPLRSVIEGALNLPTEFGTIDLDQQVEEIKDRASSFFGTSSPRELFTGDGLSQFVERFMLNQQLREGAISPTTNGANALTLLQSGGFAGGAQANLFQSLIG